MPCWRLRVSASDEQTWLPACTRDREIVEVAEASDEISAGSSAHSDSARILVVGHGLHRAIDDVGAQVKRLA